MKRLLTSRAGNLRRRLDFIFGVPIVLTIGCIYRIIRRKRSVPSQLNDIGLLQIAAIGDTVIMSAVWQDLRQQFPSARCRVLVGESNYEVSTLLFGEENIELLPVKRPLYSLQLARRMRFDVIIDFGPWPRWNAILAAMIPAQYRIGYAKAHQYRHYAYDYAVRHSNQVHELENQRALTKCLGVKSVNLPRITSRGARSSERLPDSLYVVFHPWAGGYRGRLREWPEKSWAELALKLNHAGWEVHVSGAPSERERVRALILCIEQAGGRAKNLAGVLSLAELVDHLRHAQAVISVNTGIMHIAATDARTLGLHGPTSSKRWGPVGSRVNAIESPCPGCGFLDLGFEYPRIVPACMEAIQVKTVWDTLQEGLPNR